MKIWTGLGTLALTWSGVPPSLKMKILTGLGTLGFSWSGVPLHPQYVQQ